LSDVDWNDPSLPFPGVVPKWTSEEIERELEEELAEEMARDVERENDASINALLRRMERFRRHAGQLKGEQARQILARRPCRIAIPRPRASGPAPIRRQGSRRTSAPTRAGPDDDSELPDDVSGRQLAGTAVRGTAR